MTNFSHILKNIIEYKNEIIENYENEIKSRIKIYLI